jgi:hypothetical protein
MIFTVSPLWTNVSYLTFRNFASFHSNFFSQFRYTGLHPPLAFCGALPRGRGKVHLAFLRITQRIFTCKNFSDTHAPDFRGTLSSSPSFFNQIPEGILIRLNFVAEIVEEPF